ncbi:hypothetical protein CHISP_0264 [Chitinispirillum alkaliphilum]|nr:hypothetical protein CHISP_0264 [Chitinispirillum alkaliphilum]
MSRKKSSVNNVSAVFKMRHMLIMVSLLSVVLAVPFIMVWKQAYINTSSLRIDAMSDTLSVLNREIAYLRLQCEHLASNRRIETIARDALGLEYPESHQIILLPVNTGRKNTLHSIGSFFSGIWAGTQVSEEL